MRDKKYLDKILPILFCVVLSLIIFIPFLTTDYINNGIDISYHLSRLEGLATSIKEGNFFPRIYPYKNNGYGYPWPIFYCDISLILPAIAYNAGMSLINAYKLAMYIPILLAVLISFYSFKTMDKSKVLPYIAAVLIGAYTGFTNDIFFRSGIGSVWAYAFYPLVFVGSYHLLYGNKRNALWMLVGGFTGLALTHNISFFFGVFYLVLILIFNIKRLFTEKRWLVLIIAGALSFGLCAYFLLPMLEFKLSQTYIMDQNYTYGAYVSTYVDFEYQFKQFIPYISLSMLGMVVIETKDRNTKRMYFFSMMIIIGLFFMTASTQYLNLPLTFTQFKSRTTGVAMMCCMFPGIYYISKTLERYSKRIINVAIVCLLIFNAFNVARKQLASVAADDERFPSDYTLEQVLYPLYVGYNSTVPELVIAPDVDWLYLPASWVYDYTANPCVVSLEDRQVLTCDITRNKGGEAVIYWNRQYYKTDHILFPISYYKGYEVYFIDINSNVKVMDANVDWTKGLVQVDVPEDFMEGKIAVKYAGTTVQKVSSVISMGTVVGIFLIALVSVAKKGKENE